MEAGEPAAAAHEPAQRGAVHGQVAGGEREHDGVRAAQARGGEVARGHVDDIDRGTVELVERGARGGDGRVHELARLADDEHGPRRRLRGGGDRPGEGGGECQLDEHMGSRP